MFPSGCNPEYETRQPGGPSHMLTFVSTVKVMGKKFHGKACRSKKEAQHDVAKIAYNALKNCPPDERRPEPHDYSDKNLTEKACEVVWIGFPAELKVDESILRRAFNLFGEIEKISTFPGSRYAFVRYKNISSTCTAIGSLKGKLYWNPQVHICFAKNEGGSSSSGKSSSEYLHVLPNDGGGDGDGDGDDDDDDDDERVPKKLKTGPPPPERVFTEPEFLDCTARNSLAMLSKYYYQAVGVWVVFFLPVSDADDTKFYNRFMHSLEKRQQAAVSILDNNTTLYLAPPSNFSEKVLKVPGSKLIITGVILREMRLSDPLSSMSVGSLPPEQLAQLAASLPEQ